MPAILLAAEIHRVNRNFSESRTDPERRVVTAVAGTCEGQDFSQPINTYSRFLRLFITERSRDSIIFGEVIGPITPQNTDGFHTNVQLVE